jgi:hypothetical protein
MKIVLCLEFFLQLALLHELGKRLLIFIDVFGFLVEDGCHVLAVVGEELQVLVIEILLV